MKLRFLFIALILFAFCGGEETQADICEDYVRDVNYQMDTYYYPLLEKYNLSISLYLNNEMSSALATQDYSNEFPDKLDELIVAFSEMQPNDDNLENNKIILQSFIEFQNAQLDLVDWVKTDNLEYFISGGDKVVVADEVIQKIYASLSCPTEG